RARRPAADVPGLLVVVAPRGVQTDVVGEDVDLWRDVLIRLEIRPVDLFGRHDRGAQVLEGGDPLGGHAMVNEARAQACRRREVGPGAHDRVLRRLRKPSRLSRGPGRGFEGWDDFTGPA